MVNVLVFISCRKDREKEWIIPFSTKEKRFKG
jgi:hypothetical protein